MSSHTIVLTAGTSCGCCASIFTRRVPACDSRGCCTTAGFLCYRQSALWQSLPSTAHYRDSQGSRAGVPCWSVTMAKQVHSFLRPEGSVMITPELHISPFACKGTFKQDWNRTELEETDILILQY